MTYLFFEYFIKKFYSLRDKKDRLLTPLINLTPDWIKPNTVSGIRLFLALCFLLFYVIISKKHLQPYLILPPFTLLIILGTITDWMDGALARARKSVTIAGAYIDSITDKIFMLPILLIISYYFPWLLLSCFYLYFFKVFLIVVILFNSFWRFDDFRMPRLRNYYARIYTAGYVVLAYFLLQDIIKHKLI